MRVGGRGRVRGTGGVWGARKLMDRGLVSIGIICDAGEVSSSSMGTESRFRRWDGTLQFRVFLGLELKKAIRLCCPLLHRTWYRLQRQSMVFHCCFYCSQCLPYCYCF